MATPFIGTATFTGMSGREYQYGLTVSDVAAAFCVNAKTSQNFQQVPEDCYLTDLSFAAAATVVSCSVEVNGNEHGRWGFAQLLNTIQTPHIRPVGPIKANDLIFLKQLS